MVLKFYVSGKGKGIIWGENLMIAREQTPWYVAGVKSDCQGDIK